MNVRLLDDIYEDKMKEFINKQKKIKEKSIQKNTKNILINKNIRK